MTIRVPKSLLMVAEMHDYGAFKPFRIIEKVQTIDGPRGIVLQANLSPR